MGDRLLAEVDGQSPGAQAEVFLIESESRVSEWSEGLSENLVAASTRGMALRLVRDGRLGFSYSNNFEPAGAAEIVRGAVTASQFTTADALLEVPSAPGKMPGVDLQLVDSSLAETPWEERRAFLSSIEPQVKKRDKRLTKVLRAAYREGRAASAVMNTRGVSTASDGTHVSFSLACVAVEAGETQIGYGFQAARHYRDLNPDWVLDQAVEHTLSLLGGRQVPSGRYDLILDPQVAAEMLELLATALRGDQVQKGRSFFAAKVGQQVGADCLTLVDDGRLLKGLGSSPFDAEGLPTQTTVLIKEGILQGFLYDSYTARKAGRASTGNAGRSSYKGMPEPEATNFFLKAGHQTPQNLVSGVQSGLYIRGVMGLHTVDTVSGDFSLGIMGERIEKGRRTHGVRGVTIAGNLLDLLKSVVAVGSDLTFFGSVGSPTLWISNVSVGGN